MKSRRLDKQDSLRLHLDVVIEWLAEQSYEAMLAFDPPGEDGQEVLPNSSMYVSC